MRIGDIIKEARIKKGISLDKLVKYLDREKSAISDLENYSKMPNFDTACMLCELLDVDIKELWRQIRLEYVDKLKTNNKEVISLNQIEEENKLPILGQEP